MQQHEIDNQNAGFWDELCGSALARSLGILDVSPESLERFDQAYLGYYPYLPQYVLREELKDKRVLEIGLGFGTLGNFIALHGCDYFGLDIALNPVRMMRYRLDLLEAARLRGCSQGSALALPFADNYFDYVYSIGCLHHTGNLSLAVKELHRVLKPGGKAIVMLYNKASFRRLINVGWMRMRGTLSVKGKPDDASIHLRALYDADSAGEAAPHTEFVSPSEARKLFHAFSHIEIDIQNFDEYDLPYGFAVIRRTWLLNNVARFLGLDLYITAHK